MRISDWSSDVCSSDLVGNCGLPGLKSVSGLALGASLLLGQDLPFEVVPGLVEVQVAAVPLGLAALRVDVVGTEMLLWRLERAVPVLVEGDAPVVQAAEVEPFHRRVVRSEEQTSELQSLMRISYAVFGLKKK